MGRNNAVEEIRLAPGASSSEIADLRLTAGYAELLKGSSAAKDAARIVEGRSIGFTSTPVERMVYGDRMRQNAIAGAEAYVKMDAKGANRYTAFLTERFGPMTPQTLAESRLILNGAR